MPDVLLFGIPHEVKLGTIGPDYLAIRPHPMQTDRAVLDEVTKLLLLAPQVCLRFLLLGDVIDGNNYSADSIPVVDVGHTRSGQAARPGIPERNRYLERDGAAQDSGFQVGSNLLVGTIAGNLEYGLTDKLFRAAATPTRIGGVYEGVTLICIDIGDQGGCGIGDYAKPFGNLPNRVVNL